MVSICAEDLITARLNINQSPVEFVNEVVWPRPGNAIFQFSKIIRDISNPDKIFIATSFKKSGNLHVTVFVNEITPEIFLIIDISVDQDIA